MAGAYRLLLVVVTAAAAAAGAAAQPRFEQVVAELASPEPAARARALRLLREAGYPEGAVPAVALARDPDDRLQLDAIATAVGLLTGERIEPRGRRRGAGGVLAALDADAAPAVVVPEEVFAHLAAAMGDLDPEVRREAAAALAVLGGPGGVRGSDAAYAAAERALVVMLGAAEPDVRVTAAKVAGRLYRAPLDGAGWRALRVLPEPVGDRLIALLNQPSALERMVAMEALGLAGERRAVAALADRYTYHRQAGPPLEMAAALDALARLGHPSSLPFFLEALVDRWDAVRQLGYEGLARCHAREAAAAVVAGRPVERAPHVALAQAFARERLLADGSIAHLVEALRAGRTRLQARSYLLEVGPPATPALVAALGHPDAGVRAAAAELLGRIGRTDAAGALALRVADRQRTVAAEVTRALRRLEAGLSLGTRQP